MAHLPTPMTPEAIAAERAAATASIAKAGRHMRLLNRTTICAAGLALAYLLWLYATNDSTADVVAGVAVGTAVVAGTVVVVGTVVGTVEALALALALALPLAVVVVVSVFVVAGAATGDLAFAGAIAAAGALVGGLAAVFAYLRLRAALEAQQRRLADLTDLDAEMGEHCVQYLAWCESNSDLRAYQDAIGRMGRMPIRLDYEHAEHWIKSTEERAAKARSSELAKDAGARLAGWANEEAPAR